MCEVHVLEWEESNIDVLSSGPLCEHNKHNITRQYFQILPAWDVWDTGSSEA